MDNAKETFLDLFLRKISKIFGVNPLPTIKNFGWLSSSQLITLTSSFLLSVAFANLLLPETYGIYRYLISLANIIAISSLSGINVSLATSIAKNKDGDFGNSLKAKLLTGLLGTLGGLVFASYYIWKQNSILGYALVIVSLLAPITDSLLIYNSILQGKKDFKRISYYSGFSQIIFAISIFFSIYFSENIYIIIVTYFSSLILGRFVAFKLTTSKFILNKERDPGTINRGFHLSFNSIITTVVANIDKLIIFTYLGTIELAIYSIATIPVDHIRGVFKNLSTIVLPNYATQEVSSIKNGIFKKILILSLLCLLIMGLYIILAPLIFPIIFPRYSESIPLTIISAFSILAIPALLPSTMLQAKAENSLYYRYNVVSSLTQIILLFIGAYYFKLIGVVVARTLGQLWLFAISFYYSRKIN